jgi:hypothetical protein
MRKFALPMMAIGALLGFSLNITPAEAQATRTWVSGVGDDVNPCSRTAPCKTFAGAISKTAANGEINCLDPGGFGAVTITKNMTIACEFTEGGILAAGFNAVNINAAGIIVVLRGLDIEGAGTGLIGVNILNAARVHIEKSIIHGFRSGSATGILVNVSSNVRVMVSDTHITDNGNGISMTTTGGGTAQLTGDRVRIAGNSLNGVTVGPNTATTLRNSVVAYNSNSGIQVSSGNGTINFYSSTLQNNTVGVNVASSTGRIRLADNNIHNNATGYTITAGGVVESAGNNKVGDNGAGAPNGTITQQ